MAQWALALTGHRNLVSAVFLLTEVGVDAGRGREGRSITEVPAGLPESVLCCWVLSNLGTVCKESNFPKLNRMANEDHIDFLLRSINKIN